MVLLEYGNHAHNKMRPVQNRLLVAFDKAVDVKVFVACVKSTGAMVLFETLSEFKSKPIPYLPVNLIALFSYMTAPAFNLNVPPAKINNLSFSLPSLERPKIEYSKPTDILFLMTAFNP